MDAIRDRNILNTRDDDLRLYYSPVATSGGDKRIVHEMDFFADQNQRSNKTLRVDVKKENGREDGVPRGFELDTGLNLLTPTADGDKSVIDDETSPNGKRSSNKLAVLQGELRRMNKENQRLRSMLNHVNNNYHSLQMHITAMMQQRKQIEKTKTAEEIQIKDVTEEEKRSRGFVGTRKFISERHDRTSSEQRTQDCSGYNGEEIVGFDPNRSGEGREGQRFGKEESNEIAYQESWVPNKAPKLENSKDVDPATDQATMKRVRVSVRARSEAAMISDGCQWRKYGQKMAKGNPCPRAYYRCTMALGCPVRKQVQRCAEDRTILTTTYEGNHNHPLPPSAMAMVSTTSAAASMLLSGSTSSTDDHHRGILNTTPIMPYPPSPHLAATISASSPFPTITLDLTKSSPNPSQLHRPPPPGQFGHIPFPTQMPQNLTFLPFSGVESSREIMGAAATAAISADPDLTAALVAAIASVMGNVSPHKNSSNNNITGDGN